MEYTAFVPGYQQNSCSVRLEFDHWSADLTVHSLSQPEQGFNTSNTLRRPETQAQVQRNKESQNNPTGAV